MAFLQDLNQGIGNFMRSGSSGQENITPEEQAKRNLLTPGQRVKNFWNKRLGTPAVSTNPVVPTKAETPPGYPNIQKAASNLRGPVSTMPKPTAPAVNRVATVKPTPVPELSSHEEGFPNTGITGVSPSDIGASALPETPSMDTFGLNRQPSLQGITEANKTEGTIGRSQESSPPGSDLVEPKAPGFFSKIGGGIKNLIDSIPDGGQKAHLTALAFGLGLMAKGGTYSPVPQTAIGPIGEAGLGALQLYMHMDESEKAMAMKNVQFARELAKDRELARHHLVGEKSTEELHKATIPNINAERNLREAQLPSAGLQKVEGAAAPGGGTATTWVRPEEAAKVGGVPTPQTAMVEGVGERGLGTYGVPKQSGAFLAKPEPEGKVYQVQQGDQVVTYRDRLDTKTGKVVTEKKGTGDKWNQVEQKEREYAGAQNTLNNMRSDIQSKYFGGASVDMSAAIDPNSTETQRSAAMMQLLQKAKISSQADRDAFTKEMQAVQEMRRKINALAPGGFGSVFGSPTPLSNPITFK
jgi:hypothetical protein